MFCDFCTCEDCQHGTKYISHAQTITGQWICDVCFLYDLCTSGPNRVNEPCKDKECRHRPKLISDWTKV